MITWISSKEFKQLKEQTDTDFIKTKSFSKQDLEHVYETEVLPKKKLFSFENQDSFKHPNFFPNYIASYLEEDLLSNECNFKLHHVFETFEKLEGIFLHGEYTISNIQVDVFDKIVKCFAFLQSMSITQMFVNPFTLSNHLNEFCFYDVASEKNHSKEGFSKEKLYKIMYFPPELIKLLSKSGEEDVDPFTANTYSLALTFLDWNLKTIPDKEQIEELLAKFQNRGTTDFLTTLRECLTLDPKKRPDFIDLFCKREKILRTEDITMQIFSKYEASFAFENNQWISKSLPNSEKINPWIPKSLPNSKKINQWIPKSFPNCTKILEISKPLRNISIESSIPEL